MRKLVTPPNVLLFAECAPSWREGAVLSLMFNQFVFGHRLRILTILLVAIVLFWLFTGLEVSANPILRTLSIAEEANYNDRGKLGPLLSGCRPGF